MTWRNRSLGALILTSVAVALTSTLASCSSGDDGPGKDAATAPQPAALAALVGEDGTFDCHQIYTHTSLRTYLSADLSPVDTMSGMAGAQAADDAPEVITCPVRYAGEETPGVSVPFYVLTSPNTNDPSWTSGPDTYGNWLTGTVTLDGADGDDVAVGILDDEEHGRLAIFTPVDEDAEGSYPALGEAAPAAVRTVIDALDLNETEETESPVLAEADVAAGASLFTADGAFDGAEGFRRLTLITAEDVGLALPEKSGTNPVIKESGGRTSCALATGTRTAELIAVGPPTELTTGPKDPQQGTPFVGSPDLEDWEEYWLFDGADNPVNAENEGQQSYNARYCRSDDDCITVTAHARAGGDVPQALKDTALPLVRLVAEHEDLLTDGGAR